VADHDGIPSADTSEPSTDRANLGARHNDHETDPRVERLEHLTVREPSELLQPPEQRRRGGPAVEVEPDVLVQAREVSDPAARNVGEPVDAGELRERVRELGIGPRWREELSPDGEARAGARATEVDTGLVEKAPDEREPIRVDPRRRDAHDRIPRSDAFPENRGPAVREDAEGRGSEVDPPDDLADDGRLAAKERTACGREAPGEAAADRPEGRGIRLRA